MKHAIIFDVDGVLLELTRAEEELFFSAFATRMDAATLGRTILNPVGVMPKIFPAPRSADDEQDLGDIIDDYCVKCHKDDYNDWFHSSHHFSSFNNQPYLFSVRETRRVALARDGNVTGNRIGPARSSWSCRRTC